MIIKKSFFITLLILGYLTIPGCTRPLTNVFGIYYNSGIYFYPEVLNKVKVGQSTKKEVTDILGSPSFTNQFSSDIWYYVYQKTWYIAVFSEKVLKQQILVLKFGKKGTLENIKVLGNKDIISLPACSSHKQITPDTRNYITPDLFHLKNDSQ